MEKEYYIIKPYDENLPKPPKESFSDILSEAFLHPFDWNARTTRASYWVSVLVNFIISILASGIVYYGSTTVNLGLRWIDYVVSGVLFIWMFLAGLGQTIRRLHDVGYSGYWYWASLVPYGSLFIFYLSIQPSRQTATKWGNYLYNDNNIYGSYTEKLDAPKVPVPTISQILKEHFFDCFKWNARSTRTSYWVGTAVSNIVIAILVLPIYFLALLANTSEFQNDDSFFNIFGPLLLALLIIMLVGLIWIILAQLGHTVRRLHDAGLSGWWGWVLVIPYIGEPILALLLFHPTTSSEVKWNGYLFTKNDRIQ